ncbi:hypothetical protein AYO49_06005 [Verrucomicrobiaceae bacterium SCGC AG-212-N21]|nr:hypothetical protein AYO49_06005 [Verrucomicrobiaceae bacterium SCGC AG-212-N21]
MKALSIILAAILAASSCTCTAQGIASGAAGAPPGLAIRRENFSVEPGWEGRSNRNLPAKGARASKTITQNFGHRTSHLAGGKDAGEIGGSVYKHQSLASYAKPIPAKTFDDRLSASGTLFLRESDVSSAIMVGWFNSSESRGWRTRNALAFRLFGTKGYGRFTFEYGTQKGGMASYRLVGDPYAMVRDAVGQRPVEAMLIEGLNVTSIDVLTAKPGDPALAGKIKKTAAGAFDPAFAAGFDPKQFEQSRPHQWELHYDPQGAGGLGEITFVFDGRKATLPLEPGHRKEGARFDRFGLFNVMLESGGGPLEVYFDDITIDGAKEDFSKDPGWVGINNQATLDARVSDGAHDYGFSKTNHISKGAPGEAGGIMFRSAPFSSYADPKVGPLTLDDELFASGKVCFPYATSDSGVLVGWFNSATAVEGPVTPRMSPPPFMGAVIEGPSRIGHYHRAAYKTTTGQAGDSRTGPVLHPDSKPHDFTLHYQPKANHGDGALTVTLDGESTTLNLAKGHKADGATFDRFGFLPWQSRGGHFMEIYWDDLTYTVGPRP